MLNRPRDAKTRSSCDPPVVLDSDQAQAVPTVVISGLRHSESALYATLLDSTSARSPHRIGDCLAPRVIDDAVFEGLQLGMAL